MISSSSKLSRKMLISSPLRVIQFSLKWPLVTFGGVQVPGTKINYHIFNTPLGPRSFSVLAREYRPDSRYPLGFRPELFPYVDEFAIYLHGESVIYLIPQRVLVDDVFKSIGKPSINDVGQWFCNLNHGTGELESEGLWPRKNVAKFAIGVDDERAN